MRLVRLARLRFRAPPTFRCSADRCPMFLTGRLAPGLEAAAAAPQFGTAVRRSVQPGPVRAGFRANEHPAAKGAPWRDHRFWQSAQPVLRLGLLLPTKTRT